MKYSGIIYQWNAREGDLDYAFDYEQWFQNIHDVYLLPLIYLLYSEAEQIHSSSSSQITIEPVMNITTMEDGNGIELKKLLSDGTISHGK